MDPTNRCNNPSTNIVDLISSVNTLIDNLSEPLAGDSPSRLIDRSVADINRQLEELEKLVDRQKIHSRPANQRNRRKQQTVVATQGACYRSLCSDCTASNCDAESNSRRTARLSGGHRHHRYHSTSVTSRSDSSYSRCCVINSSCLLTKLTAVQHAEEGGGGGGGLQLICTDEALQNTSNVNEHRTDVQLKPQKLERVNFGYLKAGLEDGSAQKAQKPKEPRCGERVVQMEKMIDKLKGQVNNLKLESERQLQTDSRGCDLSRRFKGDIRQLQARLSYLYSLILQTLGTTTKVVNCRHIGSATEQARDALSDLMCKYERSLLYSTFDVEWPFLHIVAPMPISWAPVSCEEID